MSKVITEKPQAKPQKQVASTKNPPPPPTQKIEPLPNTLKYEDGDVLYKLSFSTLKEVEDYINYALDPEAEEDSDVFVAIRWTPDQIKKTYQSLCLRKPLASFENDVDLCTINYLQNSYGNEKDDYNFRRIYSVSVLTEAMIVIPFTDCEKAKGLPYYKSITFEKGFDFCFDFYTRNAKDEWLAVEEEPAPSFKPENENRNPYTIKATIKSEMLHSRVVNELQQQLESLSLKVKNDKFVDLMIYNDDDVSHIFEAKSDDDSQSIYTAIGQLMYHSIDHPKASKILVLPYNTNVERQNIIKKLGIKILYFTEDLYGIAFKNLNLILGLV